MNDDLFSVTYDGETHSLPVGSPVPFDANVRMDDWFTKKPPKRIPYLHTVINQHAIPITSSHDDDRFKAVTAAWRRFQKEYKPKPST